jgi:Tol biopolymer transport system component
VSDRVATSNAAWSPDGRAVAFGTAEGVVVQGGEAGERLASPLRQATWVDWSSAGRWLAVVSQGGLWVVDLATGGARRVDLPGVVRSFRWSPSGDRGVAVVEGQGAWLWLVSAQGGLRRRLFGPVHALYDVGWFPNGLYVFARTEDARGRTVELWHVRVAGADRRRIPSPFPSVLQAQLSPTGRAVAYLAAEEGGWVVAVQEGRRARTVARGRHLWGVSWSPQGDKLSYAEVEEGGERAAVWVADADGSHRLQVADYALEFPDPDALVGTAWSPDGRAVAFGTGFAHRAGPVWVARLERR